MGRRSIVGGRIMPRYFAVVFDSPFGGVIVNFPDFPECVAFAPTSELSRSAAAQALGDFINHLVAMGRTIPQPSPLELLRLDPQNIGCELIPVEALAPATIGSPSHAS
jgi:predicted RNase H-like HicB family nuclease